MALGGRRSSAVFIGSSVQHTVVRFCARPAAIVVKCGRCAAVKDCERVAFDASMSCLNGWLVCQCGTNISVSVSLGFKKTSGF